MPRARIKINGQWYDVGGMSQQDKDTIDKQMSDNLDASKAYAEGLNGTTNQNINDMQSALTNGQLFFDQYSADGIIYDSEMTLLQGYLAAMDTAKSVLDKKYSQIYNSDKLMDSGSSTPKTSLASAKADFDSKYSTLTTTTNAVIADTRVSASELTEVDAQFSNCSTSLTSLSIALQNAINAIASKQEDLYAQGIPTDGLIGTLGDTIEHHSSKIQQNATSITSKVDSALYDNQKMQDNWYNFIKSHTINIFGDIESIVPPAPYSWVIGALPDGSQGTVLDKKYVAGSAVDTIGWSMPQISVNPSKPYLLEFWVKTFDTNSSYYFGREEYSDDGNGNPVFNDEVGGVYTSDNVVATADTVGTWVKHFTVIPPYNTGPINDHTTVQSSYTPDFDYKFYNSSTAYIMPKIYLTNDARDTTKDSEMQAWGFGLYEIGSRVNLYAQVEGLNKDVQIASSSIDQNSKEILLRVTTATYTSDMQGVNDNINKVSQSITDTNNRIDDIQQNATYKVEIHSSNGNMFRNGDIATILTAIVYNGAANVTDSLDASRFVWTRTSDDTAGDTAWNNAHSTGTKTIVITTDDVVTKATFECDILNTTIGGVIMSGISSTTIIN